jgi:hypothetical protein
VDEINDPVLRNLRQRVELRLDGEVVPYGRVRHFDDEKRLGPIGTVGHRVRIRADHDVGLGLGIESNEPKGLLLVHARPARQAPGKELPYRDGRENVRALLRAHLADDTVDELDPIVLPQDPRRRHAVVLVHGEVP